jgi:1,4-alpha-glucan branching enzyme
MEIRSTIHIVSRMVRLCLCLLFFTVFSNLLYAQQVPRYLIHDGKMFIKLAKNTRETSLDSFIAKFDLYELDLRNFFKTNNPDSLQKLGWFVEKTASEFIISKSLMAVDNIFSADVKLHLDDPRSLAIRFPAVNNGIALGRNRFRNKHPFVQNDSVVTFYLKGNNKANRVILSGSFNNWSESALAMQRTDSGWVANVKTGPGKYWYKFIVDGRWMTDPDNMLRENDGDGNTNSVFFFTNYTFKTSAFSDAKKVYLSGSFNNWKPDDLEMLRSGNEWVLPVYLANGTHTYKFVVNGKWYHDEQNTEKLPDGHGGFNSVVRIGKSYLFKLDGFQNAKEVKLAGNFNEWREDELYLHKTAAGWELPYVLGPGNYEYRFVVDGKRISDPANKYSNDNARTSFLTIQPNYTFRLKGMPDAKKVFLAGDFNDWKTDQLAMQKQGDEWIFDLNMAPGKHRYKFIVDGQWIIDPNNKLWEQNEYGTGNSILWIEE